MTASLDELFRQLERGVYPPADFRVTRLPQPSSHAAAVVATTGHVFIAADAAQDFLDQHVPVNDPGGAFNPPFLRALELHLDRRVNNIDVMTMAAPLDGRPEVDLTRTEDQSHPRVRRALRYRDDLRVYSANGGVLVVGRGLAGRWEAAVEVDPDARGKGLGRTLARAARQLVPEDRPIWAQIAPGNAASLRAFLSAGFVPVGQEALLVAQEQRLNVDGPTP